jgi:succinate dehydrogenase / fumarate reductase cytochrome b subunit
VYHNFVVGFRPLLVTGVYVVAMLFLGLHLYHGVWSLMQTLGLSHPRYDALRHAFATLVAVVVVVGNISMPVAVLAGWVAEPARSVPSRADARPSVIGQE